ncbi:carbohydrate-binding protein [Xylanibacillus composti]|nr:carbohydrate-binding protein [Xylanibacillus composti]
MANAGVGKLGSNNGGGNGNPGQTAGIYEAEHANYSSGSVDTNHSGYSGSGFVNVNNANGEYIEWTINASTAGTYSLSFRYANGASGRSAKLSVNGSDVLANLNFPVTSTWNNWQTVSATVFLNQGSNKIRLTATNAEGLANIDYLRIAG